MKLLVKVLGNKGLSKGERRKLISDLEWRRNELERVLGIEEDVEERVKLVVRLESVKESLKELVG